MSEAFDAEAAHRRVVEWYVESARLRADEVSAGEGWTSVRDLEHPHSHDGNRLLVHARTADPPLDLVERETAGLSTAHRAVSMYGETTAEQVLALQDAGYVREDLVLMAADPAELEPVTSDVPVVEVDEPAAAIFATEYWHVEAPYLTEMDDGVVAELVHRRQRMDRSADVVRLAVMDGSRVAAAADIGTRDGITELDGVAVLPEYRQRGYGDALLAETVRIARRAGSRLLVLEALAEDWPRTWYAARGLVEVGLSQSFVKVLEPQPDQPGAVSRA